MNITGMGTISSYLKSTQLNMKWQERKLNPNKEKDGDPRVAEIRRWSEEQRRSQEISSIHGKMMSGSELSKKELEYLLENNPELYKQAVQIQEEREVYKKELAGCKSKEDVEKLNQRKLNRFAGEAKSISGNPNIPKGKKVELLEFLSMRMNAVMNERAKFMQSKEYYELPDKTDEKNHARNSIENEITDSVEYINNLLASALRENEANEPVFKADTPSDSAPAEKSDSNADKSKKFTSTYA